MNNKNELDEETRVVFRMWQDEVIAIFPDCPGGFGYTSSYMHVGQHGDCDFAGLMKESRPATEEEYISLKEELERHFDYVLEVLEDEDDI